MIDFTSALYLGMRHPSWSLRPWQALSAGKPAALESPEGSFATAQAVAKLMGCERGTLLPSTLHGFWDLFGLWAGERVAIYMDSGCYPIARWGVERAKGSGTLVRQFPHDDVEALEGQLKVDADLRLKPIIVADGFCPASGRPAPVRRYLESARELRGYLIIDDTQALGILGEDPNPKIPYGMGGGGSLQWQGLHGADILIVSSLAKGFGVPVAILAGSHDMVRWFEMNSEMRLHCSPPSVAAIRAAEHALAVNERHGDDIRLRLAEGVSYFRGKLHEIGLSATGGLFPVQTLVAVPWLDAPSLHDRLLRLGVRTVLRRARNGRRPRLSFLITALHSMRDIDHAADALAFAVQTVMTKNQSLEGHYEIQPE